MAEEKKKQTSKSKATAEKKPTVKKTATAAKKGTTAKKTATAAKKETTAKKTATAKKETAAKKTATAAKKETAAKKTATAAKKETATKKTATAAKKETAAKKTATAAKKETTAKKTATAKKETAAKKEAAVKKTVEPTKSAAKPVKKENEKVNLSKTTFVKAGNTTKKWIILDAAGKPLGRVAALAASMLRGKHKVDFTPNVDCGDSVIIINCRDAVLTGKKLEQKIRYHHSGWMGGIKETKYSELMKKEPQKAMTMAVEGMLPHNSLGARMARHLRTYKDENHGHEAQKPEVFKFKV